jgi:hypothetical protein
VHIEVSRGERGNSKKLMQKKINITSFDFSGYEPVITQLKRHSSRPAEVPRKGDKRKAPKLTALRRAWRALEKKSSTFVYRYFHD